MIRKILAVLVGMAAALLLSIGIGGPATAQAADQQALPVAADPTAVPISGTMADGSGVVAGTFDVQRFVVEDGVLNAVGTFTGTVTDRDGTVTQGTQAAAIPVGLAQAASSCQILDLVLGPVDLDLLGLQVHLDTVHLNITADAGPGNLVGNLLCAVAGLLDGGLPLSAILGQIAALLNQLLGILG